MSKSPRHLSWLVGGILGFSLMSACGTPEEQPGTELVAPEAVAGDIAVSLSTGTSSLSARDDVQVTVTLTNVSGHSVRLLERNTPVDGIKNDLFNVTRDGVAVAYIGRHYKWAAPQAEDYLTLAAGESLSRTVSMADAYDFAQTGSYTLGYAEAVHGDAAQFTSNRLTVWVEGRPHVIPEEAGERIVTPFAVSTTSCSSTQPSPPRRATRAPR
jgi:peptidyl-Lys metalloendopeptidase